jgi:hypothetical protein
MDTRFERWWSALGIKWDDAKLSARITQLPNRIDRALTAVMRYEAPRAERYMKSNAPWTDRTGNARNGLHARAFAEKGRRYGIDLAHSVPYGIWLEVRFSGRYKIIPPTIRSQGPEVMRTASTLFSRL